MRTCSLFVFVCVCVYLLLQSAVFYFFSENLYGPVWEVKGDKGERSKKKVNDIRETENEREKLSGRKRGREKSVKNGERVGWVEVRRKR